mmetsp:Transcript_10177/g.42784  ORF Transcript_10177/g.42784 Transcript_10177/m.42784 type:complete len:291 (+) Transcript_10177:187-1059(+)
MACFELIFSRVPRRFHPPTPAAARSEGDSGPSARKKRRSSADPLVANLRSSASSARMSNVAATRVIWSERSSVSSSSESTPSSSESADGPSQTRSVVAGASPANAPSSSLSLQIPDWSFFSPRSNASAAASCRNCEACMARTRAAARSARLGFPVREIANRSVERLATPNRRSRRRRSVVSRTLKEPSGSMVSSADSDSESSSASAASSSSESESESDVGGAFAGGSKSSLSDSDPSSLASSSYVPCTTNLAFAAAATSSRRVTSAPPPCGFARATNPYRRSSSSSPSAP